jgi:TatD DNase family protein
MREAQDDTLKILVEEEVSQLGGVFHCFTGDLSAAQTAIQLNFMISFSGIVTFSKAHRIQNVVQQIPLEHLMIETDCPYLTPAPHRGKRNEPAYVRHVAKTIAELKPSYAYEDVVRITSENTLRLLKLPDLTV